MRSKSNTFGSATIAAALAVILLVPGARAQTTYTWAGTTNGATWSTAANWTPSGGPPGSTSTVTNNTDSKSAGLPAGTTSVGTISGGTTGWAIYGVATTAAITLNASTVSEIAAGNLKIRDTASSTENVTLNVNTITVANGGQINLGDTPTGQELNYVNPGALPTGATPGLVNGSAIAVNLNGTGTLTLNVLNDYSLGVVTATGTGNTLTLISNGATNGVGDPAYSRNAYVSGLAGSGALTVNGAGGGIGGNATLIVAGSAAYSSGAVLANTSATPATSSLTLSVQMTGGGSQTLTGASTFTGGTTVAGGTLYVSNASGSGLGGGAVTVNSGGTLGGGGFIAPTAGDVTINGILSPGDLVNPLGTLTFTLASGHHLNFGSGSQYNVTLGSSSSSVAFGGALANYTSGMANLTLNVTEGSGFQTGVEYVLFSNATTATAGSSFTVGSVYDDGTLLNSSQYALTVDGAGGLDFEEEAAVPEPGAYALLLGGAAGVWAVLRRRSAVGKRGVSCAA